LNQIADVGVSPSIYLKLISGEIIFKVGGPILTYVIRVPERHRQTDRRHTVA